MNCILESLNNDLPKFSEEYNHQFKYERYGILESLYKELKEEYNKHRHKTTQFTDIDSLVFRKIIGKFKNLFGLEDGEAKIIFDSVVRRAEIGGKPFFRFTIKKFDPEESKLYLDAGRSNLVEVDYVPINEDEQFFINRHYVPETYCTVSEDELSFALHND